MPVILESAGVAAVGGGRKRNAFGGPGASVGVLQAFLVLLLIHLCATQPGFPCRRDAFPPSEVAGFIYFFFLQVSSPPRFLKGIVHRMLCSWQLACGARGESSLLLVVLQIAAVKAG